MANPLSQSIQCMRLDVMGTDYQKTLNRQKSKIANLAVVVELLMGAYKRRLNAQ